MKSNAPHYRILIIADGVGSDMVRECMPDMVFGDLQFWRESIVGKYACAIINSTKCISRLPYQFDGQATAYDAFSMKVSVKAPRLGIACCAKPYAH